MKKKKLIHAHPSITIAYCMNKGNKLFMEVYDPGYFMKAYVGSANPIGGNPNFMEGDREPLDVIRREIKEEYNPNHGEKNQFGQVVRNWASKKDIILVRNALLTELKSWEDFYCEFKEDIFNCEKKGDAKCNVIYSVFYSQIDQDVIECIEDNIHGDVMNPRKVISYEGLCGIFTLDDLIKGGEFGVAHAAAPILNQYFSVNIPYPSVLEINKMGLIQRNFRNYLDNFDYYNIRNPNKPEKPSFYEIVFGTVN